MNVDKDFKPHESHDMTEWENTIVTISSTSRFGDIRECKKCTAEEARTVCGHAAHNELSKPCSEA